MILGVFVELAQPTTAMPRASAAIRPIRTGRAGLRSVDR
jgi:hypothetical protein